MAVGGYLYDSTGVIQAQAPRLLAGAEQLSPLRAYLEPYELPLANPNLGDARYELVKPVHVVWDCIRSPLEPRSQLMDCTFALSLYCRQGQSGSHIAMVSSVFGRTCALHAEP